MVIYSAKLAVFLIPKARLFGIIKVRLSETLCVLTTKSRLNVVIHSAKSLVCNGNKINVLCDDTIAICVLTTNLRLFLMIY